MLRQIPVLLVLFGLGCGGCDDATDPDATKDTGSSGDMADAADDSTSDVADMAADASSGDTGGASDAALDLGSDAGGADMADTGQPEPSCCETWTTTDIERSGSPQSAESSLVIGPDGNPRFSFHTYAGQPTDGVRYAAWDGTQWNVETIFRNGIVGQSNDLAVHSDGTAHVAFSQNDDDDVMYARQTADGWDIETVATAGEIGLNVEIALDAAGRPHLTYHDISNRNLVYATSPIDGQWTTTVVEVGDPVDGWIGNFSELVVDAAGVVHVVYNVRRRAARYARFDGVDWTFEDVFELDQGTFTEVAIALDSNGEPHVTFVESGKTYYGARSGSGWIVEQLAESTVSADIAVDSRDRVHVVYWTRDTSGPQHQTELYYGQKYGTQWSSEPIYSAIEHIWPSLAVDALDRPHITHHNWGSFQVAYIFGE